MNTAGRFLSIILLALLQACGGGGNDNRTIDITLQQGEFEIIDIRPPKESWFRIEGCPEQVCSSTLTDLGKEADVAKRKVKFFTTNETPTGTYSIKLVSYIGGNPCQDESCTPTSEKVLAEWECRLNIVEGGLRFERTLSYATTGSPRSIKLADVNRDGLMDIVTLNENTNTEDSSFDSSVSIFFSRADGSLEPEELVAELEHYASDFLITDVDNDDIVDLFFTHSLWVADAGTTTYKGITPRKFEPGEYVPLGLPEVNFVYESHSPHYVDIDHDGTPEIVVVGNWYPTPRGNVIIMEKDYGKFKASRYFTLSHIYSVQNLEVADVDGDKQLDLTFLTGAGTYGRDVDHPKLYVLSSDKLGDSIEFSYVYRIPASPYTHGHDWAFFTDRATSLRVVDMNNDMLLDTIVGVVRGESIYMSLGTGSGLFDDYVRTTVGAGVQAITVDDFNNDAILDVLTANGGGIFPTTDFGTVSILAGNGVGGFQAPSAVSVGAHDSLNDIATADFDRNGRLDFVVSDYDTNKIILFIR